MTDQPSLSPITPANCPHCGESLTPGVEICPRCLGPVVHGVKRAHRFESPVAEPAPLPEEPCAVHALNASTGVCGLCGLFFCDVCASKKAPGFCVSCEDGVRVAEFRTWTYTTATIAHMVAAGAIAVRSLLGVFWLSQYRLMLALPFVFLAVGIQALQRPVILFIAVVINLVIGLDAYSSDDWLRVAGAAAGLVMSGIAWLRLPETQPVDGTGTGSGSSNGSSPNPGSGSGAGSAT